MTIELGRFWLAKALSNLTLLKLALLNDRDRKNCSLILPNGMSLRFDIENHINVLGYVRTVWDYDVYGKAEKGDVVFDVGASIGSFVLKNAEIAKIIVAFEPAPNIFDLLVENLECNGILNVTPVNAALSSIDSMRTFHITQQLFGNGHELEPMHKPKQEFLVKCTRLDTFLANSSFETIDFMKIDIEGHEIPMLEGAEQTLSKGQIRRLSIAVYHYPKEAKECKSFLMQYGYACSSRLFPNGDIILKAQLKR